MQVAVLGLIAAAVGLQIEASSQVERGALIRVRSQIASALEDVTGTDVRVREGEAKCARNEQCLRDLHDALGCARLLMVQVHRGPTRLFVVAARIENGRVVAEVSRPVSAEDTKTELRSMVRELFVPEIRTSSVALAPPILAPAEPECGRCGVASLVLSGLSVAAAATASAVFIDASRRDVSPLIAPPDPSVSTRRNVSFVLIGVSGVSAVAAIITAVLGS